MLSFGVFYYLLQEYLCTDYCNVHHKRVHEADKKGALTEVLACLNWDNVYP